MVFELAATAGKIGIWLTILLSVTPVMVWIERRGCALIQDRKGPNRVGPFGLFQALADAVKLLFKEDIIPSEVDRPLYLLAPILALVPALTIFTVIPFGPDIKIGGQTVPLNDDAYLRLTFSSPDEALLSNSFSVLDGDGKANATFTLPSSSPVSLIGMTFHYAYVVFDPPSFTGFGNFIRVQPVTLNMVSNTVSLTFVP